MDRILRDPRAIALFIGPALVLYTAILIVPIIWSAGYTLFSGNTLLGFHYVGVDNYTKIVDDPAFWHAFRFTIKYAVLVTVLQVVAGLGLALLYVFYLRRASSLVRTLAFFPVVLPTTAVAQLFAKLFEITPQNGLVNSVSDAAGFGTHDWIGSPTLAFVVLVIMDVWRSMGFYAVLLYAGLVDVPEDIIESARLDGASGVRLVRSIVLPLLMPILVSAVIFSINGTIKVFDSVLALTGGGPGDATTPLTLAMFRTAFTYGDYGYGSTIAMSLTLLSLVVTIAVYRSARQDVTV